ncbi:MAG TPA: Uma2 family endonuclease [Chitinophagales bacterium]|nr:Uma2 family endonuclease [Chitinophagales bacterium]
MAIPVTSKISIEEYLELERAAPFKSEYYKGEVYAMAGASTIHNAICSNLIGSLNPFLRGKNCKIFGSDQKVHVIENTLLTYPDAVIICGENEFTDREKDTITNPSVIFEVLSATTKKYDRREKFELYKSIPSFTEYILISSEQIKVDVYRKQPNGKWLPSEYKSIQDQFTIEKIGYEMKLADLYDGISFPV